MKLVNRCEASEAAPPWQSFAVRAMAWICLCVVLLWILFRIYPALLLPWWFNTDEVVMYYEVIRQLRLDPSQTFFDIPGTPYMAITSVLTASWWAAERILGVTGTGGPSDFAFANAQGVFTLMRVLTMGMYLGTVALAFDLFRRAAGALTAIVACILLASLPIHVQYSYFARTESLGLLLTLSGAWIVLYSRWRGNPEAYGLAGVLAGVAMGARYHFVLVGLPVLLAIYLLRDRDRSASAQGNSTCRLVYASACTLAGMFVCGAILTMAFKANLVHRCWLTDVMMLTTSAGPAQYAVAKRTVSQLWLMGGLVSAGLLLCHKFARGRTTYRSLVNPSTLLLVLGFSAGFLLSHPTFLWRGEYQLKSIQFYTDWTDPHLASIGPLRSWFNVSVYYFGTALPERWIQVAFFTGAAIILWRRHAVHLAFLGGAALCAFAHPLAMKLWPHHVIPWLPLICFVAAVPAGVLGEGFMRLHRRTAIAAALVLASASILVWACAGRLRKADDYLLLSRERMGQIAEMNAWLSKHLSSDALVLMSYFALNEDGFLKWIEGAGVSVPGFAKKHGNVHIWWLDRASLDGRAGFLCVSRADIAFFREDFERRNPGSTYNPFEDSAFEPLSRYGGGFYELQVFRFDLRHRRGGR